MPIKPENKNRYPKDWPAISKRIREREGNCCKFCGLANGLQGYRALDGTFYSVQDWESNYIPPKHENEIANQAWSTKKLIKIVLTVAHLDHTPENCDDSNLAALCQACHNRYDQPHRQKNARITRNKKKQQLELFL